VRSACEADQLSCLDEVEAYLKLLKPVEGFATATPMAVSLPWRLEKDLTLHAVGDV